MSRVAVELVSLSEEALSSLISLLQDVAEHEQSPQREVFALAKLGAPSFLVTDADFKNDGA
jgi:hypothetical protein